MVTAKTDGPAGEEVVDCATAVVDLDGSGRREEEVGSAPCEDVTKGRELVGSTGLRVELAAALLDAFGMMMI